MVSSKSLPCLPPADALPDGAFPPVGRLGRTSPPSPVLCAATTATLPVSGASLVARLPDTLPASRVRGVPHGLMIEWKPSTTPGPLVARSPSPGMVIKEPGGSPTFPSSPCEDLPRASGRNTARATVGREFPSCTLSVCAAGSSFRHSSRFRKPPSHPGRSDFPSPVGSQ